MLKGKYDSKVRKFSMQVFERNNIEILFQDILSFITKLKANKNYIYRSDSINKKIFYRIRK